MYAQVRADGGETELTKYTHEGVQHEVRYSGPHYGNLMTSGDMIRGMHSLCILPDTEYSDYSIMERRCPRSQSGCTGSKKVIAASRLEYAYRNR